MMVKPTILSGFLELLPKEQILFNNILDTIRSSYERFGFLPIDTPVIEKSEILLAKAGGETEQQIYRFTKGDNDLSLRFDLTVPLARYVSQHFGELSFPFRRYQIGKVYRGERPQRGRFREFYQCDIDIIGNEELSMVNDAELPSVIYYTFKRLNFGEFKIRINNRKLLNGFFESLALGERAKDVLRIIDKIDKIGKDEVKKELLSLSLSEESVEKVLEFIGIKGSNKDILDSLKKLNVSNDTFALGLSELEQVVVYIGFFGVPEQNYTIDLTIARGLDYYTGTVYETILVDYPQLGSICSGGRYENLADNFTNKKLPGVGVSIGLSRLFFQLNDANIIKSEELSLTKVLVVSMIDDLSYALKSAAALRNSGINTEVFFDKKSMKAKFSYADKLGIPYVLVIGEDEISSNRVTIKNMQKGEQNMVTIDEAVQLING